MVLNLMFGSVMPALVAGIHAFLASEVKAWMAGTSPAMTADRLMAKNS
jgi:hypothetical protein